MIGMAAMVGGSTGAALTAVTMIFEMTRDYDIVMPMIVAWGDEPVITKEEPEAAAAAEATSGRETTEEPESSGEEETSETEEEPVTD